MILKRNLTDVEIERYFYLGNICKQLKEDFKKLKLKDPCLIEKRVLERISKEANIKLAFPVLVTPDNYIGHKCVSKDPLNNRDRVSRKDPFELKDCKLYTIDIGLICLVTRCIIDNAITIVLEENLDDLEGEMLSKELENYKKNHEILYTQLSKKVTSQDLKISHITKKVEELFETQKIEIIPECGAHVVDLDNLHSEIIPMKKFKPYNTDCLLSEGISFTIEPHMSFRPYISSSKEKLEPPVLHKGKPIDSNIVSVLRNKEREFLIIKAEDLESTDVIVNNYPAEYLKNNISFYQEHQYLIHNKKLHLLT